MWQQQEVVSRLVDIIQKLQSRYETGQLTAKPGNGSTMEEGVIVFVRGKITEVRLGRRSGAEALNKLSNWENCVCWFAKSTTSSNTPSSHIISEEKLINTHAPLPIFNSTSLPQTDPIGRAIRTDRLNTPSTPGIPYPTGQPQVALRRLEQLGFSRTHRRLLLLIDGRRSIPDLVRLMGRDEEEVRTLLQNLVQATVIGISDKPPSYNI
jgi:hypothetical protein